ncbi:uncharacterized protein LOC127581282 isoform X2 [Pristis pectinata]|uniref:uncharacterized protein LOC127581282 isoform X2 n=1 Tax=Pristis pectinata TaxID=685728 RepID=UPI00223D6990|nr:uncharacterized protein LOC127581282 isoform X2 [Pristis pectinata]
MGILVMLLFLWGHCFRIGTLDPSLQYRSLQYRSHVSVQYFDYPEEVSCTPAGLMVRIRNDSFQGMSIRLSIVDDFGEPRDLRSLHSSCRFATIPEANGSLLFITPYDGCFVHVVNNIVSMELRIDGIDESKRIIVIERIPVNCSLPTKPTPVSALTTVQSLTMDQRPTSASTPANVTPVAVKPANDTTPSGPVTPVVVKPANDTAPGVVTPVVVKPANDTTPSGPVTPVVVKPANDTAPGVVTPVVVKPANDTAPGVVTPVVVKPANDTTPSGPVTPVVVKPANDTAPGVVTPVVVKPANDTTPSGPVTPVVVKPANDTAPGVVTPVVVKPANDTTPSGPVTPVVVKPANDTAPGVVTPVVVKPANDTTPSGPVTPVVVKPANDTTPSGPVTPVVVKPANDTAPGVVTPVVVKPANDTAPGVVTPVVVKPANDTTPSGPVTPVVVKPANDTTPSGPVTPVVVKPANDTAPGVVTPVVVKPANDTTPSGPVTPVVVKPANDTTPSGPVTPVVVKPANDTTPSGPVTPVVVKPANDTTPSGPVTPVVVKPANDTTPSGPVTPVVVKPANDTAPGPVTPVVVKPATDTAPSGPVTPVVVKPANATPPSQGFNGEITICAVSAKDRVHCGNISLGEKACKAKGCCYDSSSKEAPCFYGKTAYIDCTSEGLFTIVVPKVATVPSLDLDSVILANNTGSECAPTIRTAEFVVFSFPLNACGSVRTVAGQNITYQVDVVAKRRILKGAHGSITRDSTFRLHVKCFLSSSRNIPLTLRVKTPSPPSLVIGDGILTLEMRIAKDKSYSSWFADEDYPLVRYLREPVYVEVHLLHRLDANIALVLNDCWATQTQDPHLGKQWSILVNGCPYYGDNYMTQLHTVNATPSVLFPTHHKWFEVKTFQFWDQKTRAPLHGKVYFHCSATVCPLSDMECAATCNAGRRMVRNSNVHSSIEALDRGLVTLKKPIIFTPEESGVVDYYQANENVADNILLAAAVTFLVLALITGLLLCWNCKQMHKP